LPLWARMEPSLQKWKARILPKQNPPGNLTSIRLVFILPWYIGTMMTGDGSFVIERVQTGVRMEKRLLKVLKAFADYHDLTLGDLLEGIVLHAFDGKIPFGQGSLNQIKELKQFYGLELDSSASHRLKEAKRPQSPRRRNI
jgi:hypothetical protein